EMAVSTPNPYDDNASPMYRRSPAVNYEIVFPDGATVYMNDNPSSSMEWEQYRISIETMDRATMDAHADEIPAGIYTINVKGMDLGNVNAWRFFNDAVGSTAPMSNVQVLGVDEAGNAVLPLRAVELIKGEITGKVFYDANADGTHSNDSDNDSDSDSDSDHDAQSHDSDSNGGNDSDGGSDSDNDNNGDSDTNTTNDRDSDNDSDSEGDSDKDTNGDSDNCTTNDHDSDGTAPGAEIGGEQGAQTIMVILARVNADGTHTNVASTMTDEMGEYKFADVAAGTYRVTVDVASLSTEAVPVSDPDGILTPHYAVTTIAAGNLAPRLIYGYKLVTPPSCQTAKYWMDNSASWPVQSVVIGAKTYSKEDCIKLMKKPTKVDKTVELSTELICAKLNRAAGAYSDHMAQTIIDADAWLTQNEAGKGKNTTAKQKKNNEHNGYSWSSSLQGKCDKLSDFNRGRDNGNVH
ncbi:MAG: hypothetical protein H7X80_11115, partial [bacterium]|nr:hypothetical protein [Candidatus Kapabacteria bacterium]